MKKLFFFFFFFIGLLQWANAQDCNDLRNMTSSMKEGKNELCTTSDGVKIFANFKQGVITSYEATDSKGKTLKGKLKKAPNNTVAQETTSNRRPVSCQFCVNYRDRDGRIKRACVPVDCNTRENKVPPDIIRN